MKRAELPGAFVVSLDFELAWGVRDRLDPRGPHRDALLGARDAVGAMLDLFEDREIAATWAIVGFLFAATRAELRKASPTSRPEYEDPALDPYPEPLGEGEADDPLHFAASLVEAIGRSPRQEIGTHTFSHFYCKERGQTRDDFRADLDAACRIAEERGVRLRSIVFPRNQRNPAYDDILLEYGITAYRGNPDTWCWRFSDGKESRGYARRGVRWLDAYLGVTGSDTIGWHEILQPDGLSNIRSSRVLRPYDPRLRAIEPLRLHRIRRGIRKAAREGSVYHLWWHPHNFGRHLERNLRFLGRVLEEVDKCRSRYGMASLAMAEVGSMARSTFASVAARPALDQAGIR